MEGFDVDLREQLAGIYRSDRWICVATMAAVADRLMDELAEAAGFKTPAAGEDRGPSPLIGLAVHDLDPDPDDGFPILSLDLPSSGDLLADVLGTAAAMTDLPPAILENLDAWDPDCAARVLVPPILTGQPVAGREVFGGRPPAWAALEDKLAVLELWADLGIATAPADIVSLADDRAVEASHRRLAGSHGTVWAVDNNKGMHGGAAGTHWVPTTTEAAERSRGLKADHHRVRIMPFLTGVPCSIHGIVLDDVTVTTRPNEMLVYVDETTHRFHYCRFGNHWDPPPEDREVMAGVAKVVGDALRDAVDFRGVFSLDGVLTVDGFRPTEVNPRYGMALPSSLPVGGGGTVDLLLLDKAIIAGAVRPDGELLQRWLVEVLDGHRQGGASFAGANRPEEPRSATIVADESALRLLEPEERDGTANASDEPSSSALAAVSWRPLGAGQRLWLTFGDAFPVGPPAAPLAWRMAQLVDEHWNVGLEELTPALSIGQ